jgi:hypothetical protein
MSRNKKSLADRQQEMRQRQPVPSGPGRPPLPIDAIVVERLARYDHNATEIAALLRCSPNTIRNRFADEIARGHDWFHGQLLIAMFKLAVRDRYWPALRWQLRYRGLCGPAKVPRRSRRRGSPLSTASFTQRARGRTYKPFHNRYPAKRKPPRPRSAVTPLAAAPPATDTPEPEARKPWVIAEFFM